MWGLNEFFFGVKFCSRVIVGFFCIRNWSRCLVSRRSKVRIIIFNMVYIEFCIFNFYFFYCCEIFVRIEFWSLLLNDDLVVIGLFFFFSIRNIVFFMRILIILLSLWLILWILWVVWFFWIYFFKMEWCYCYSFVILVFFWVKVKVLFLSLFGWEIIEWFVLSRVVVLEFREMLSYVWNFKVVLVLF